MRNVFNAFVIIAILFVMPLGLYAQDAENIEQVGRLYNLWNRTHDVCFANDIAFVAADVAGLQILDISNPEQPQALGHWDDNPYEVYAVEIVGNHVYLVDQQGGLFVIDVSDPTQPTCLGSYWIEEMTFDLAVEGNVAFLSCKVGREYEVRMIDISNPENLQQVGIYNLPDDLVSFSVSDDILYLLGDDYGFSAINIADPGQPQVVGDFEGARSGKDFVIGGENAFIALHWGLLVLDISNLEQPDSISFVSTESPVEGLSLSGNNVYLACRDSTRVYDCEDLNSIEQIGVCETLYYPTNIIISDNYAYLTFSNGGLQVMDISNSARPAIVNNYWPQGKINGVCFYGDFLYLSDAYGGLKVVDTSEKSSPQEITHLNILGSPRDMAVFNDWAYIACEDSGVCVVDICRLDNPIIVGYCPTNDARAVALSHVYAYIADGYENCVKIFDIVDPEFPFEVGSFQTEREVTHVCTSDNYLIVSEFNGRIHILDIDRHDQPEEISAISIPAHIMHTEVYNNYVFVAGYGSGVWIIDINDPATPVEIGSYDTPGQCCGLTVQDGYVYVADAYSGVRVLDVSDLENPLDMGFFNTPGRAQNIIFDDGYFYVGDGTNLGVYRFLGVPIIEVSADSLNFGEINVGQAEEIQLEISNESNVNTVVSDISCSNVVFQSIFEDEFTLEPHSSFFLTVAFSPDSAVEYEADLTILSNDSQREELNIALRGCGVTQGVGEKETDMQTPSTYSLSAPHPNPFNAVTRLTYGLPKAGRVNLSIYDIHGREIATLFSGEQVAGKHSVSWNAEGAPSGVYFCRLTTTTQSHSQKVVLVR